MCVCVEHVTDKETQIVLKKGLQRLPEAFIQRHLQDGVVENTLNCPLYS